MSTPTASRRVADLFLAMIISFWMTGSLPAQPLAEGLVAYWPMDAVVGGRMPDLVGGYDLSPYIGPAHTLTNADAITLVAGHRSNCVSFTSANRVLLGYLGVAGDDLPINQHPALTISFWVNAAANQTDLRMFSEGNVNNNNPLFNLGTSSGGAGVDLFFRQQPSAAEVAAGYGDFGAGSHIVSSAAAYDNSWHQVVLVQQTDGTRALYIDGALDGLGVPAKPAGAWNVNATSVGGILRSTAAAWPTALIDEVALWKRALTSSEIQELKNDGLSSVFPPLANGLVAHWPLDAVVGGKLPDQVGGYDLSPYVGPAHSLTNGDAIALVSGYKSNCVSFVSADRVLLGYLASPNDELPINKNPALTVSFWVNAAPNQTDLRMFSEGNVNNNNPLFNLGTSSGGAGVDLFFRQQPSAAEVAAGYGDFGAGAHIVSSSAAYDTTWHQVVLVQQPDGSRSLYIDGVLDALGVPAKPAGQWNVNATSVGGILRSTAAAWSTARIDEVALWKRALTPDEINDLKARGVPKAFRRKLPLQIKSFAADRAAVTQGDTVILTWEGNAEASYSISPGIGDVSGRTVFGVGNTGVVVNAGTTYTLTAARGSESTNATLRVDVVTGVAPGWRVIENFEFLTPGYLGGQANWQNALTSISGALRPANVVDTESNNRFLGLDGENVLAGKPLNSMALAEGQSGTFFFRFLILPDPVNAPDIDINLGLTEKGLRDVQDFRGGNNGPAIRIIRQGGAPIDLRANNGVAGAVGASVYSFVSDPVNNPAGAGLEPGAVYDAWIDIQNRPFDVVAGVQNGGDLYALYLQKAGEVARRTLFEGFRSDRDAVNIDVVLGAPGTALTHLFLCANNQVSLQTTNKVRFDDFFISTAGFNATVPVPPGAFLSPVRLGQVRFEAGSGLSFSWKAIPGKTYTIKKRLSFSEDWAPINGSFPAGGAVDENLTFLDTDALFDSQSFYFVVENP